MLVPWLFAPHTTFKIYLLLVLLVSPICFVIYGWDKRRAVKRQPRISERTLHMFAFVGGWPGAWLGQRIFHHKSEKLSFRLVFWLIVAAHLSFVFLVTLRLFVR